MVFMCCFILSSSLKWNPRSRTQLTGLVFSPLPPLSPHLLPLSLAPLYCYKLGKENFDPTGSHDPLKFTERRPGQGHVTPEIVKITWRRDALSRAKSARWRYASANAVYWVNGASRPSPFPLSLETAIVSQRFTSNVYITEHIIQ